MQKSKKLLGNQNTYSNYFPTIGSMLWNYVNFPELNYSKTQLCKIYLDRYQKIIIVDIYCYVTGSLKI